jgi:hypothetical protein
VSFSSFSLTTALLHWSKQAARCPLTRRRLLLPRLKPRTSDCQLEVLGGSAGNGC